MWFADEHWSSLCDDESSRLGTEAAGKALFGVAGIQLYSFCGVVGNCTGDFGGVEMNRTHVFSS